MRRQWALTVAAVAAAVILTGCGVVNLNQAAKTPTFDESKAQALVVRDDIEASLPGDVVTSTDDIENQITCDENSAQFDGTRTLEVESGFDRAAWLDSVASTFESKSGWKVVKKVAADDSSDATSGLALSSEKGVYVRLDEFGDGGNGSPAIVLSASGPCGLL